jgi:hypothetical protein
MKDTRISITEVTISTGKKQKIFKLVVDGKTISIPVDNEIFAHYKDQLWRENPSKAQRDRFATVMNLMRAAYLKRVRGWKH